MRFRWKMTFCMICLLSLLFGIGGSALIAVSFLTSLDREEQTARETCRLLLESLRIRDENDQWIDEEEAVATLRQMTARGTFSAIRLSSDGKILFSQGSAASDFRNLSGRTAGAWPWRICGTPAERRICR